MSIFLEAFSGTNRRIPVWLMRQAGRYLPEYMAIRKNADFMTMMQTPDIAAEVTCLPVRLLNVDAAILFADILTLPIALGIDVLFIPGKGPVLQKPLRSDQDTRRFCPFEGLPYLEQTIRLIHKNLPENIPLIGFAGSPFTVMTYLIEGGSSKDFRFIKGMIRDNPHLFKEWMDLLTGYTIEYLQFQKKAGIAAFQLFDTWGGILNPDEYKVFILPYVQRIFAAVDLPSIYFLKKSAPLLALMDQCGADFLSFCESVDFGKNDFLSQTSKGIQGNFYNKFLYEDEVRITMEAEALIQKARRFKRYIFNLSHGLLPDMDPAKVKFLVELVQSFDWNSEEM